MDTHTAVLEAIYKAIDETNPLLSEDKRIEKSPSAPLFGGKGVLDSLGLVNFIVEVEQQLEDELDITLTLADEKAFSQHKSPFKDVKHFADYIEAQMELVAHA